MAFVGLGDSATRAQPLLPDERQGEWHVLLLAATSSSTAGQANYYSMKQAEQNFEVIASTLGIKLFMHRVSGEAFTQESVKKGVRELLKVEKPERGKLMATVMSFTHGMNFPDTWTQLPFIICHPEENRLAGKNSLIAIEDIYQTLRTFGAFDHLHVWAELCNNIPYGLEREAPKSQPLAHSLLQRSMNRARGRLRKLLMSNPATVMVSSKYGQVSYTFKDGGGVFTNSLFLGIEKVANGEIEGQWEGSKGLFAFIQAETRRHVRRLAGSMRQQAPQGFIGNVPNSTPQPSSNIVKAYECQKPKPENTPPAKSPMDILKELWK